MEKVLRQRENSHMHCIQRWALTRFDVALDRVIGDSQVSTTHLSIGVLELEDGDGRVGTGFFHTVTEPLPSLSELRTRFAARARRPGHRCEPFRVGQSTGTPSRWTDRRHRCSSRASSRRCGTCRARSSACRCTSCSGAVGNECRPTRVVSSSISPTSRSPPSTPARGRLASRRSRSRSGTPIWPATSDGSGSSRKSSAASAC